MQRRWFKRRIFYVCLVGILLYIIFRARTHNVTFEVTIKNSNPMEIWEFVADFSNMKKLNPTILDFNILSESGNYEHWKYSAHYTEYLTNLPFVHHFAFANFDVKPEGTHYLIRSTHNTCFLSEHACLASESEFRFIGHEGSTKCIENVTYNCPLVLSMFCHSEVMHQRRAIMANLQKQFTKSILPTSNI